MMVWVKRAAIAAICLAGLVVGLDRLFPPPLERAGNVSTLVSDRDGKPLRAIPLSDGTWRFAADLDAIDPVFIEALLA
ncbi:MAG: penicillin-binding protein 1C, partial [Pseudomonadota bacterium]